MSLFKSFALLGLVAQASAFPSHLSEAVMQGKQEASREYAELEARCPHAQALAKRQAPGVTPPFDASEQYVSTTGEYAFVAPSSTDARGPCKISHVSVFEKKLTYR